MWLLWITIEIILTTIVQCNSSHRLQHQIDYSNVTTDGMPLEFPFDLGIRLFLFLFLHPSLYIFLHSGIHYTC